MEIRRLRPGDEDVVRQLASRPPHFELLEDERTILLVAFEEGEPIGFALAHHLPRRHDPPSKLLVYEVDVDEAHRRRGVGKALLAKLSGGRARAWDSTGMGVDRRRQRGRHGAVPVRRRPQSA